MLEATLLLIGVLVVVLVITGPILWHDWKEKKTHSNFIIAWKKRISDGKAYLSWLREKAYQESERCASILQREYQVKKVILYGSILDKDRFSENSDIDLAVEGLDGSEFFDATGRLIQESRFRIQLLPFWILI